MEPRGQSRPPTLPVSPGEEGDASWDPLTPTHTHTHTHTQASGSVQHRGGGGAGWGQHKAPDSRREAVSPSPGDASQTWAEGLALCSLPGRSTDWVTKGHASRSPGLWGCTSRVSKQAVHSKHLLAPVITQGKCHVCHCAVRAARRLRHKQLHTSINIFNGVIPTLWCTCFRWSHGRTSKRGILCWETQPAGASAEDRQLGSAVKSSLILAFEAIFILSCLRLSHSLIWLQHEKLDVEAVFMETLSKDIKQPEKRKPQTDFG